MGFLRGFFQHFWPEIGNDITATVLNFLKCGGSVEEFNKTFICLIPKVKDTVKYFRPISVCNTVYKIAAKVLANRLKTVLLQCFQSIRVRLFRRG